MATVLAITPTTTGTSAPFETVAGTAAKNTVASAMAVAVTTDVPTAWVATGDTAEAINVITKANTWTILEKLVLVRILLGLVLWSH